MHLRSALAIAATSLAGVVSAAACLTPAGASAAHVSAPVASAAKALSAWHFATEPHLQPPEIGISTHKSGLGSGLIFLTPYKDAGVISPEVGQPGALVMDESGNPVWFQPAPSGDVDEDLQPQTYAGKPVLTFWQGVLATSATPGLPAGTPEAGGHFEILSQNYKLLKTVAGQGGWNADFHELLLTPQGDAIYLVARTVKTNLTKEGGAAHGSYEDSGVQEVNLKTGKVVFTWDMGQHIALTQSALKATKTGVYDPFHLNSIFVAPDKTLLLSARNTWSLYDIDVSPGKNGAIKWTLDAKPKATDSTYKLGPGAAFSWQHDAQIRSNGEITLFDDHCCGDSAVKKPLPSARGEVLKLSSATKRATLVSSYYHVPPLLVPTQGNLQTLPNGNVFVDFGQQPVFSAYTATGKLIFDASLPAADSTYRAYLKPWTGLPTTKPAIKVTSKGSSATVYVSWNGATQVTGYELLAGTSSSHLKPLGKVGSKGFETAIPVNNGAKYTYAIKALNAKGAVLGTSVPAKG